MCVCVRCGGGRAESLSCLFFFLFFLFFFEIGFGVGMEWAMRSMHERKSVWL